MAALRWWMVRNPVQSLNPGDGRRRHGSPRRECRTLSEPSADGSDVEPGLIHTFGYFTQRRRTRVGAVVLFCFFFLIM